MSTRRAAARGCFLALLSLLPTGCDELKTAAANPSTTAPLPPAPVAAVAAVDREAASVPPVRLSTLAAEGEAVKLELDDLDAEVQRGLEQLSSAMKDFEADRRSWTALDRSVAAARAVNRAVGARNKAVVSLYDAQVAGVLARFAKKLKEAPGVYRRMAAERRRFLAEATLDLERRSYLAMAETCEAGALLCERRHEELFGAGTRPGGFAGRPARRNATALAETIDNMRKLSLVHDRWEETFAAYPSSLDDGRLAALFDHLSSYAEDLEAFTRGVEALKGVMTRKAVSPDEPPRPAPNQPAEPPPAPPAPPPPAAAPPVRTEAQQSTPPRAVTPSAPQPRAPTYYYAGQTPDGRSVYYAVR